MPAWPMIFNSSGDYVGDCFFLTAVGLIVLPIILWTYFRA